MKDHDLIDLTMQEARRVRSEPVGPNPWSGEPTIATLREVLERKHAPRNVRDQTDPQMGGLDLGSAIHLRWTLRDIRAKRTKFSPVSPDDLRTLIEMGLIEMQDDAPVLTSKGHRAID